MLFVNHAIQEKPSQGRNCANGKRVGQAPEARVENLDAGAVRGFQAAEAGRSLPGRGQWL